MLQIKEPDYEKIISYAKEHLPEEACGLVAGCLDGGVKKIKKIYFLFFYRRELKKRVTCVTRVTKGGQGP